MITQIIRIILVVIIIIIKKDNFIRNDNIDNNSNHVYSD